MTAVTKATVHRFCETKNEFTISELDFHKMNNLWQLYCSAKHWEGSHLQPRWNVNLVPVECPPAYPCSPLLWVRNRQPYSQVHVENLMFRYSKCGNPEILYNSLVKNTDDLSLFCSLMVVIIHTVETYYFFEERGRQQLDEGWENLEPWWKTAQKLQP
jgi:hypothetical protein